MDISALFPAGPILTEEQQIGRTQQITELAGQLRGGDVVRMFYRRRWGKSSVASAALERLRADGIIVGRLGLDAYPTAAATARHLVDVFSTQPSRAVKSARSLGKGVGGILRRGGDAVGDGDVAAAGELLAGLAELDTGAVDLGSVLEQIVVGLAKTRRRAAIALDEAHVIASWDDEDRAALRAFLARSDRPVGVALASSDEKATDKLRKPSVLGYLGEEFALPPIPQAAWEEELANRFRLVGCPITGDALAHLLTESRCHPYCTMLLAKQCAVLGERIGEVTDGVVLVALATVEKHEAWNLR